MAEISGLGRLGVKNAVLEASVQVQNPVPPACYVEDSLRNVMERQVVRLDDPGSGATSQTTIV